MSSSVFFKFKSQKEPSRVTFDGTGISVFELKREIITINKLGDGTDFDLAIYNQDTNEEYDEDTTIIPRSTYIIARRLPPAKPGRGSAQRYVSGKMPTVHNAGRIEKTKTQIAPKKEESSIPGVSATGSTEEDRIAAMFQASSEQWNKTQEQMAAATPIHRGGAGNFKKPTAPVPNHPPPNGYICYRCGEKGHWIQACPTNTDPQFDNRTRIKRTTGIPRSFLKTVEKPTMASSEDDAEGNPGNPSSVMVNADGEYVVAEPDKASWESYQQKAAKSTAQSTESSAEIQEIKERGLECPIDHKLFKDAVKTPCCSKVYCEDCIQSALLESDFVCPACESKDIYLDNLVPDEETRKKVEEYMNEKKESKDKPKSPPALSAPKPAQAMSASQSNRGQNANSANANSRKRPAEDDIRPDKPRGPTAVQRDNKSASPSTSLKTLSPRKSPAMPHVSPKTAKVNPVTSNNGNNNNSNNNNSMPNNNNGFMGMDMSQLSMNDMMSMAMNNPQMANMMGMGNMNFNNMNGMGNMNGMNSNMMGMGNMNGNMMAMNNMGMNGMGGMNNTMGMGEMNNMMGMNGMNGGQNHMGMNQMNMNQQVNRGNYNNNNAYNNNPHAYNNNNMNNRNGMNQMQNQYGNNQKFGMMQNAMNNNAHNNNPHAFNNNNNAYGHFPNQQRTVFSEPFPSEEDSPYMRKPVNPHRHNRPKRIRPSDFKSLGGGD